MFNAKILAIRSENESTVLTMKNPFTGDKTSMSLPIGLEDFKICYDNWQSGALIQHAFKQLSADHREFIMTGITPKQWDKLMEYEDV